MTLTLIFFCHTNYFFLQAKAEASLDILHHHLLTLQHLHERYVAYRMAFNKLILEIGRRIQYREAAENIAKGMMKQLDFMTQGNCFLLLLVISNNSNITHYRGKPGQESFQCRVRSPST